MEISEIGIKILVLLFGFLHKRFFVSSGANNHCGFKLFRYTGKCLQIDKRFPQTNALFVDIYKRFGGDRQTVFTVGQCQLAR